MSGLSPEKRNEVEELLAGAEPWGPFSRGEKIGATAARVSASSLAACDRWEEAWQVMAAAVPDDPSDTKEAAELQFWEVLLDLMHRGVEAARDRLVDDVENLIAAGHPYARYALLKSLHGLLLVGGRVDESLRLVGLGGVDPLEQITGLANLLHQARPNVFTLAGDERVVAGADRMWPYAEAICRLWRGLPADVRRLPLTAREVVVWALAMSDGDVSQALTSFGPDDRYDVERLCRCLRWFGLDRAVENIAEAVRECDFARTPSPDFLVACLGRVDQAIDMFATCDDWTERYRLLGAIRKVPAALVPRLVEAIDREIDSQVRDPELALEGPHHTATTLPALLRKRAVLTGDVRALPETPHELQEQLASIQLEELIALALATSSTSVAARHYAALAETDQHDLVAAWGRYHSDVPARPLMRMLLELPAPGMRALAIAHYVAGLARRGLLNDCLL
jgi:hypothetical protein